MLVSLNIWIALSKQSSFGPNSRNVSNQYFKLEIEAAAEKSIAYATTLASELVFLLVISYTISMSDIS